MKMIQDTVQTLPAVARPRPAAFTFDGRTVRVVVGPEGDPLFVAKDVASALGYSNTKQAVSDHCKHAKALKDMGVAICDPYADQPLALDPQTKLIPESDVYRLTMRSALPSAERFQDWVVEEVLPQIRATGRYLHAPALPDFTDPVAAARAWADAEEARLLAEQKLLEEQPFSELGHLVAGTNTMTRRDFISLLKDEHGIGVKEREFTQFLEAHYCYRDQLDGCLRARSQYAHLFKLEVEPLRGMPRPVLKVTGEGVMHLTPKLVAAFGARRYS